MYDRATEHSVGPDLASPGPGGEPAPVEGERDGNLVEPLSSCTPLVRLIVGEVPLRAVLTDLFAAASYDVAAYEHPSEFIGLDPHDRIGCLVLDVTICKTSGLARPIHVGRSEVPFRLTQGAPA